MDIADEMINEIVSFKMPAIMRNQDEALVLLESAFPEIRQVLGRHVGNKEGKDTAARPAS